MRHYLLFLRNFDDKILQANILCTEFSILKSKWSGTESNYFCFSPALRWSTAASTLIHFKSQFGNEISDWHHQPLLSNKLLNETGFLFHSSALERRTGKDSSLWLNKIAKLLPVKDIFFYSEMQGPGKWGDGICLPYDSSGNIWIRHG